MIFEYIARPMEGGSKQTGTIDAPNAELARNKLIEEGLIPLDIEPVKQPINIEDVIARYRPVPLQELVTFTRNLATMFDAQMSGLQAVATLEEQETNPKFKEKLRDVVASLEAGIDFSDALAEHPDEFDVQYIAMVRAGEVAGNLDGAMRDIALRMEKDLRIRKQIKSAMIYPKVVMSIAGIILAGMLLFIVPVFAGLFTDVARSAQITNDGPVQDTRLPLPTRIVVGISHILFPNTTDRDLAFWAEVGVRALVLVLVFFLIRRLTRSFFKREAPREWWDRRKLKLPMKIGDLIQKIAIARFARSFASLLSSAVPVIQALEVVADTAGNVVISKAVLEAKERMAAGATISAPLQRAGVFPPMVTKMIQVGEESGNMEMMLTKIAEAYEDDVDVSMKAFQSLVEPILIFLVGIMIGAVVIACYLPMFTVYNLVGG